MPFLAHQANQALGQLLDGFVEGFARAVAIGAQNVVLRVHDTGQGAHSAPPRSPSEVAEDFLLEGRREQVARAHRDAEGHAAVLGAAGEVLLDGEAGI